MTLDATIMGPDPDLQTGDLETLLNKADTKTLEDLAKEYGVDVEKIQSESSRRNQQMAPTFGREEGQTFWNRLQASFKSTPKERYDFYKEVLGPENVGLSDREEILWRHPQKGWQTVDEAGPGWGDIADLGGDIPDLIGMALSSRFPGGPFVRGALSTTSGDLVKQGVEQAIPGQSDFSVGEAAGAAIGGGVANKVGDSLGNLLTGGSTIRDRLINWIIKEGKSAGKGFDTPFARESARMSEKFDIPLTASQITQGPTEKTIAGYAARSPFGIAAFERHDRAAEDATRAAADRLLAKMRPDKPYDVPVREFDLGDEATGRVLKRATDATLLFRPGASQRLANTSFGRFALSPAGMSRGVEELSKWFSVPRRNPSEVRSIIGVLYDTDPLIGAKVASHLVERAVQIGQQAGEGEAAGFSRRAFRDALPRPEILKELYPGDKRTGEEIARDITELSELLSRSLWQGGQRPVLQESPFKSISSTVSQETMFGKAKTALERILIPKGVALFETDAQARADIFAIIKRMEAGLPATKAHMAAIERIIKKGIAMGLYEGGSLANPKNEAQRGRE